MPDDDAGHCKMNGAQAKFVFANDNGKVETPIGQTMNPPAIAMFQNGKSLSEKMAVAMHLCVVDKNNQNLSPAAKETL